VIENEIETEVKTELKKPKKPYKNKTSHKAFHNHVTAEFHRIREEVETLPDDKAVIAMMSVIFWWIVDKNKGMINSIKISDYIKQETYLDHWFLKLANDYSRTKDQKKSKKRVRKKVRRKFGIFDVPKKK